MPFSKSFPRNIEGKSYPVWEEVSLTEEEEHEIEKNARKRHIELMQECIDDAKLCIEEKGFKGFKEDILKVAVALFEKRASHLIYWKENKAKEKFDELFSNKSA